MKKYLLLFVILTPMIDAHNFSIKDIKTIDGKIIISTLTDTHSFEKDTTSSFNFFQHKVTVNWNHLASITAATGCFITTSFDSSKEEKNRAHGSLRVLNLLLGGLLAYKAILTPDLPIKIEKK